MDYLAYILFWLGFAIILVCGAVFLGSLARRALRDGLRHWRRRLADAREQWAAGHFLRMIRHGRGEGGAL